MRSKGFLAYGFIGALAFAQEAGPEFEAATIKPTNPAPGQPRLFGMKGGPGTKDPSLFTCDNCPLAMLFSEAYGLPVSRISGPTWMNTQTYAIGARVSAGARKDELPLMLRSLLIDRLKIETHREKKEMAAYDLLVAKGGSRLKLSASQPAPPASEKPIYAYGLDKDGYPNLPQDFKGMIGAGNGKLCYFYNGQTMNGFADFLSSVAAKPIIDETGLTGKYNLDLRWQTGASEDISSGVFTAGNAPIATPTRAADLAAALFEAVQSELGLRLESKKRLVELLVIDHVERMPLDN
jgi:uncharacterized protein (TIGR03435 family)